MEIGEEFSNLNHLLDQRWSLNSSRYEMSACLILATYEWMLSFAKEVELIHKRQWTWFKVLYLACRYYPFIGLGFTALLWRETYTREDCLHLVHYQVASLAGMQIFPYVIMLVRCYVFLGRRQWYLVFSTIAVSLSLANQVVALCKESFGTDDQFKFTGKYGCFPVMRDTSYGTSYVGITLFIPLIFDGVSTVAILHHHWKNREIQSPLSELFVQQAMLYFSVNVILSLLVGGFQIVELVQLDGRALVAFLTLPNLMACRLVLQLREKTAIPTLSEAGQQISLVVRRGLHPEESAEPLPP